MAEGTRPRPILAGVICFYEAVMVFLAVMRFAFVQAVGIVNPSGPAPKSPVGLTLSWLGYALAVGIVVTLWQMRRAAFYLAAAKLCLVVLGLAYALAHPAHALRVSRIGQPHVNMQAVGAVAILFIVISLSINAGIAFYIGDITRPTYGTRR